MRMKMGWFAPSLNHFHWGYELRSRSQIQWCRSESAINRTLMSSFQLVFLFLALVHRQVLLKWKLFFHQKTKVNLPSSRPCRKRSSLKLLNRGATCRYCWTVDSARWLKTSSRMNVDSAESYEWSYDLGPSYNFALDEVFDRLVCL